MKTIFLLFFSLFVTGIGAFGQSHLFIAQGAKPTVFMQDSASTPNEESVPAFMPDGKTVYIANKGVICFARKIGEHWTKPMPISFAGKYRDWDPSLTPDGRNLLFVSNRPYVASDGSTKTGNHLWMAQLMGEENQTGGRWLREGGRWSEPKHLDSPVNQFGLVNYGPSISASGTICFCSRDRDGNKGMHAFLCRRSGDHYEKPQMLLLNGNDPTFDPCIAADERYILFSSDSALYISYRKGTGWSRGEKLGSEVNEASRSGMLWGPILSRDGKTLYYCGGTAEGIEMIPVNWSK